MVLCVDELLTGGWLELVVFFLVATLVLIIIPPLIVELLLLAFVLAPELDLARPVLLLLLAVELLVVLSAVFFLAGEFVVVVVVAVAVVVAARGVSRARVGSSSVLKSFVDSSSGEATFELDAVLVREVSNVTMYGSTSDAVDDVDHSDAPKAEDDWSTGEKGAIRPRPWRRS